MIQIFNIAGGRSLNAAREREISVLAQVSDGNGVQGNTLRVSRHDAIIEDLERRYFGSGEISIV
jgi:hypothetical protein